MGNRRNSKNRRRKTVSASVTDVKRIGSESGKKKRHASKHSEAFESGKDPAPMQPSDFEALLNAKRAAEEARTNQTDALMIKRP